MDRRRHRQIALLRPDGVVLDPYYEAVSFQASCRNGQLVDESRFLRSITQASGVKVAGNSGTGFLAFNGTANAYLSLAESADFGFGLGDYTLEMEVLRNVTGVEHLCFDTRKSGDSTPRNLSHYIDSTAGRLSTYDSLSVRGAIGTVVGSGAYTKVMFARRDGTVYGYVNGEQVWTYTVAQTFLPTRPVVIGANFAFGANINGHVRDIRITRGIGRQIATYAPRDFPLGNKGTPCRWDNVSPYNASPLLFQQDNRRIALTGSDSAIAKTVRGTVPRWTGKWYFEIKCITIIAGTTTTSGVGIASEDHPWTTGSLAGSGNNTKVGVWPDSTGSTSRIYKGTAGSYVVGVGTVDVDVGVTVGIAIDIDAQKIWIATNNTWHNSGNPGAGTNPSASGTEVPSGKAWYPACSPWNGACSFDLNASAAECLYAPPSGFSYWS